jgi:DNA-binding GntR family transcriptional regulator
LGISRGPVREAIRRLEERGLVERLPFKGVRVVELATQELLELTLIREHVEGLAARLAASNIDKSEAETLTQLLRNHERSNEQQGFSEYFQPVGDLDFHFRIVKAAASERLLRLFVREIYHPLRAYRYRSSTLGRTKAALDEHRLILQAIHDRDSDAAERLMRSHIAKSRSRLILGLEASDSPPRSVVDRTSKSSPRRAPSRPPRGK